MLNFKKLKLKFKKAPIKALTFISPVESTTALLQLTLMLTISKHLDVNSLITTLVRRGKSLF